MGASPPAVPVNNVDLASGCGEDGIWKTSPPVPAVLEDAPVRAATATATAAEEREAGTTSSISENESRRRLGSRRVPSNPRSLGRPLLLLLFLPFRAATSGVVEIARPFPLALADDRVLLEGLELSVLVRSTAVAPMPECVFLPLVTTTSARFALGGPRISPAPLVDMMEEEVEVRRTKLPVLRRGAVVVVVAVWAGLARVLVLTVAVPSSELESESSVVEP